MKCLRVPLCALFLGMAGCSAADKAAWEEAKKDARGENMEMRSTTGWGMSGTQARPAQSKSSD